MKQVPSNPYHKAPFSIVGGILSYVVPGLGQIYQGRIGKGLLFFFCLYALFFYGQYLGDWQNVYIQNSQENGQAQLWRGQDVPPNVMRDNSRNSPFTQLSQRARFVGQMMIGAAAWPAVWQYLSYDSSKERHPIFGKYQRMPSNEEIEINLRNSDKTPDLGWMYTVIAGVLNILVIYDALAGPAMATVVPVGNKDEKDDASASEPVEAQA